MVGRTGYTATPDTFDPAVQIDAAQAHFDALIGQKFPLISDLPSTGNWIGRTALVEEDKSIRVCTGLPSTWKWASTAADWTAYTPVWSAAGGGVVLGNSVISGAYFRVGKRVDYRIYLKLGSTANYGAGQWRVTLPFAAKSGANFRFVAGVHCEVAGTGYATGSGAINPGSNLVETITVGNFQTVTNTTPTWTTNSVLAISGTYEVD